MVSTGNNNKAATVFSSSSQSATYSWSKIIVTANDMILKYPGHLRGEIKNQCPVNVINQVFEVSLLNWWSSYIPSRDLDYELSFETCWCSEWFLSIIISITQVWCYVEEIEILYIVNQVSSQQDKWSFFVWLVKKQCTSQ